MPKMDGQLALDFVLELLRRDKHIHNLSNYLDSRDRIFDGKYREVGKNAIVEAWTNLFLDGWIGPDPSQSSDSLTHGWLRLTSYGKSQLESIGEDYYPIYHESNPKKEDAAIYPPSGSDLFWIAYPALTRI